MSLIGFEPYVTWYVFFKFAQGARLEAACQKDDVTVTIGTGQCRNVKLSDTAITCEPPADTPGQGKEFAIEVRLVCMTTPHRERDVAPW